MRYRGDFARLFRFTAHSEDRTSAALHDIAEGARALFKKAALEESLVAVADLARRVDLIQEKNDASIDATGMESHHVSRHFLERAGRMTCYRRYPKWTMVAHHESYLLFGMHLRYGPCQDSPSFVPAVTQAARHLPIDRLSADGAYDVEAHHRYSREQLGIRSTIIPINPRRAHQHEPKTKYRAQLHRRFPRRLYGSRWYVEAAISQHKRKLGSALSTTSEPDRESECVLRHIVHNPMNL